MIRRLLILTFPVVLGYCTAVRGTDGNGDPPGTTTTTVLDCSISNSDPCHPIDPTTTSTTMPESTTTVDCAVSNSDPCHPIDTGSNSDP